MTWDPRECPRCGQYPVRWDPSIDPSGVLALRMDNPVGFRCDGCGASWVSDVEDDVDRGDGPVPDGGEPIGPDGVAEVANHMVSASGLSSGVPDGDGDVLGHVLMLDYDDVRDILAIIGDLEPMDGVSVVLESSSGSYHGYNLSVRPFADAIVDGARSESDLRHVRASARRGYYVLRITDKLRGDGEVYKDAPTPVWVGVSDSDRPQSEGHLRMLEDAAREDDRPDLADDLADAQERLQTIGDGTLVDHYLTVDDYLKSAARGESDP
jgi:hypothetical protein